MLEHRKLGDRNKLSLGTFVLPLGFTSSYYFFKDRNTYIVVIVEVGVLHEMWDGTTTETKGDIKSNSWRHIVITDCVRKWRKNLGNCILDRGDTC